MKKFLILLIAVIGFGISANAQEQYAENNNILAYSESTSSSGSLCCSEIGMKIILEQPNANFQGGKWTLYGMQRGSMSYVGEGTWYVMNGNIVLKNGLGEQMAKLIYVREGVYKWDNDIWSEC